MAIIKYNDEINKLICDLFVNNLMEVNEIQKEIKELKNIEVHKIHINRTLRKNNIPSRRKTYIVNKELEQKLCDLYSNTEIDATMISSDNDITVGVLYGILRKNNISLRSEIDQDFDDKICFDYINTNLTQAEIGQKHGICAKTAMNIVKRNDIPEREKILSQKRHESYIKCDDNFFEIINTREKAWTIAVITGDGHVTDNKKNWMHHIVMGINVLDIEILEKIKFFMKAEQPIYKYEQLLKSGNIFYGAGLTICRKKLWDDIVKLGVTNNKSKECKIPKLIPDEFLSDYIRGLVCSDGNFTINTDNQIMFSIASSVKSHLEEIQEVLVKNCGIDYSEVTFSKASCYHLHYTGNDIVRKIFNYIYPNSINYGDIYPRLDRKYNYALKHFDNFDKRIRSRSEGDSPLDQRIFGNPLFKDHECNNKTIQLIGKKKNYKTTYDKLKEFKSKKLEELKLINPNPETFIELMDFENKKDAIDNMTIEEMQEFKKQIVRNKIPTYQNPANLKNSST